MRIIMNWVSVRYLASAKRLYTGGRAAIRYCVCSAMESVSEWMDKGCANVVYNCMLPNEIPFGTPPFRLSPPTHYHFSPGFSIPAPINSTPKTSHHHYTQHAFLTRCSFHGLHNFHTILVHHPHIATINFHHWTQQFTTLVFRSRPLSTLENRLAINCVRSVKNSRAPRRCVRVRVENGRTTNN